MNTGRHCKCRNSTTEAGVANLIEYVIVSGVLMVLLVVMILLVNQTIMQGPAETLSYTAFTDVGNGISTRIVDVYSIAPTNGTISTGFDIPDDIAGMNYYVEIGSGDNPVDQNVKVYRGSIASDTSLAGIGATRGVTGNTTGRGLNRISYDSGGF
ncbi:MAG: hypothetical protein WC342_00110 [Methanoregula sp.]|jgi:hypothetical protein